MRLRSEKKGNEASLKLQLYTCDIFYFTENLKQRQNVRLPQLHSRPHDLLNYDVIVSHSWRIMFPPPRLTVQVTVIMDTAASTLS